MRFTQLLGGGAMAALLVAIPAQGNAQTVSQELQFGGGSHFEFAVPVQGQGEIVLNIDLPAGTPVKAFLFSPREGNSVALGEATGSMTLSYHMPYRVERWQEPEEWMVNVLMPAEYSSVIGTVRVSWPTDGTEAAAVVWRNAGPMAPADRARVAARLDVVERTMQHAGTNGAVSSMVDAVRTRLGVLANTPAQYLRHDHVFGPTVAPLAVRTSNGPITVNLRELVLDRESLWHADHDADQVYVAAAVIPTNGGTVAAGQSAVYRLQHAARGRYTANTPIPLEQGNVELVTQSALGEPMQIMVALIEREHGGAAGDLARFRQAAELFAMYQQAAGSEAVDELCWMTELVTSGGDALIGPPILLTIRPSASAPATVDVPLAFARTDADYRMTVRLASARQQ